MNFLPTRRLMSNQKYLVVIFLHNDTWMFDGGRHPSSLALVVVPVSLLYVYHGLGLCYYSIVVCVNVVGSAFGSC